MDSMHDLGGRQGFGRVEREEDEPVFHDRWEAAVYTIANHMMRQGVIRNVDQFRHGIERIDPVAYLTHGYYGRWLGGVENLLTEAGVLQAEQMAAAVEARGGCRADLVAARPREHPDQVPPPDAPGAGREVASAPRFSVGELVKTAATSVSGHTRLPAYARGRIGTIVRLQGGWVYPDTNAHGRGEQPQHLYCVCFEGSELWGEEAESGQSVCLDLFESYLTAVAT
jgi:nitrile hydratase